jgi:hypothetical protein
MNHKYEKLMEIVLDADVECVKFGTEDEADIIYTDGTIGYIRWHANSNQWIFAAGYSTDCATATGMYDGW